jgi:hypothetical protein
MDMDAPCFLYTDDIVYGKYFDASIGILLFFYSRGPPIMSLLLFVRSATRVKSLFLLNKGLLIGSPLLFIRGATRVKSVFFAE